ncbi:MAG: hypothetical protein WCV90_02365 [Candidatus Woesearchaeota archaeon]|jgi:hypothetical protein
MKPFAKYLLELGISLLGSLIFGIFGLMLGMSIGGTFGFPEFHGLIGYESGGIVFSLIGISIGSILSMFIASKLLKEKGSYLWAAILGVMGLVISLLSYNYNAGSWLFILWIIPATLAVVGFNYQRIFEKR